MKVFVETKKKQYRTIYEMLCEDPRISCSDIAETLQLDWKTARERIKEAFDEQHILGPQIRRRSHKNTREYVYFVKSKNPAKSFLKYIENMDVVYHATMFGFSDMWIVSKKKIEIEEDILFEGFCSDYHVSFPPDRSWIVAIDIIQEKVERFDPAAYSPQGIIKTHFDEEIEWDEKDELLFRYFKYNMRKALTHAMEECQASIRKVYKFLRRLPETCTVATAFYPETLTAYDPFLFVFETDYEDFIIELFSELPSTSTFFKVGDMLFAYVHVPKPSIRSPDIKASISKLHIPLLVNDLIERGIAKSVEQAIVNYSWGKDL